MKKPVGFIFLSKSMPKVCQKYAKNKIYLLMRTIVPNQCVIYRLMKKKKINWEEIKYEYVTTDISYRKLAEKHGIGRATIQKRASKEKWVSDRNNFRNKTEEEQINSAVEDRAKTYTDLKKEILNTQKIMLVKTTEKVKALNGLEEDFAAEAYRTQKTIESIHSTIEKLEHPVGETDNDKEVKFVIGEELKELFK